MILPPRTGFVVLAPAVTPDGGYVDVLEVELRRPPSRRASSACRSSAAHRWQLLGNGARSGIGWSPDGRRMAFIKSDMQTQNSLAVADAQGQNAKVLVTRHAPSFFLSVTFGQRASRPSWSPDGRRIAVIGIDTAKRGNQSTRRDRRERRQSTWSVASKVRARWRISTDRWVASTFSGTASVQWQIFSARAPPWRSRGI